MNIAEIIPVALAVLTAVTAALSFLLATKPASIPPVLPRKPERTPESDSLRDPVATAEDGQFQLLRDYHNQSLNQAKQSFVFSLTFAALGFAVIVTAIFLTSGVSTANKVISVVSGSVIEAVSALFFVQSNKARQLMIDFFDRLRVDKKLGEALALSREIADGPIRSRLQVLLALELVQAKPAETILSSLLARNSATPAEENGATGITNSPLHELTAASISASNADLVAESPSRESGS